MTYRRRQTSDVLPRWQTAATEPFPVDSHLKDGIIGVYFVTLGGTMTGDRTIAIPDSAGTIALLELAQTWTAEQIITATAQTGFIVQTTYDPSVGAGVAAAILRSYLNNSVSRSTGNYGVFGQVLFLGAGNLTNATSGQTAVWADVRHQNAGTVTLANAISARAIFAGAGATGTITTLNLCRLQNATLNNTGASGTIGTQRGLYIEALTSGGTNIAIDTNGGIHYLRDTVQVSKTDAVTNAVTEVLTVEHDTSGTAAASFGVRVAHYLESSTTARQLASAIDTAWSTATHALRTSYMAFSIVVSAVETEIMRITSNGVVTKGRQRAVATKSADYVATGRDEVIVFTATGKTLTLPAATGSGQTYTVYAEPNITVTIDGNSTDTIDGQLTQTLDGPGSIILHDYAANKWCIG